MWKIYNRAIVDKMPFYYFAPLTFGQGRLEEQSYHALCLPILEVAPSPALPGDVLDPKGGLFVLSDQLYWGQDLARMHMGSCSVHSFSHYCLPSTALLRYLRHTQASTHFLRHTQASTLFLQPPLSS